MNIVFRMSIEDYFELAKFKIVIKILQGVVGLYINYQL